MPIEHSKKSRFATYLGIFSIVAAVILILQGVSTLSMMNSISSRPEYKIAEQMMPSLVVSRTQTIVEMVLQMLGIIASIGLLNRLNWGRMMYMAVLTTITVWGIYSSIESYLSISPYLKSFGMGESLSLLLIGNGLALGINVYLLWKLNSRSIKDEFIRP